MTGIERLLAAWTVYDQQCERRPIRPMLPTPEASNAVMDESARLADRIGVAGGDLRGFMQALRRGGWPRDVVCVELDALAERLERRR